MSLLTTPRWFLLLLMAVATQVTLMLADVVFVFYYATFSKPGLEQPAYSTFAAETAGAFIFCFAPPVLYLISKWLCRKAGRAPLLHAALLVLFYYVIDILIVLVFLNASSTDIPMQIVPYVVNGFAMLAGALLAGWNVHKEMRGGS